MGLRRVFQERAVCAAKRSDASAGEGVEEAAVQGFFVLIQYHRRSYICGQGSPELMNRERDKRSQSGYQEVRGRLSLRGYGRNGCRSATTLLKVDYARGGFGLTTTTPIEKGASVPPSPVPRTPFPLGGPHFRARVNVACGEPLPCKSLPQSLH